MKNKLAAPMQNIRIYYNNQNHVFSKMILKCESCIESWIFPTFFDWLLFIPGPRPLITLYSSSLFFYLICHFWRLKSSIILSLWISIHYILFYTDDTKRIIPRVRTTRSNRKLICLVENYVFFKVSFTC